MGDRELITTFKAYLEDVRRDASAHAGEGNCAVLVAHSAGKVIYFGKAFSNSSSLGKAIKEEFAASIPDIAWRRHLVGVVPNPQGANHTEPKLFVDFVATMRQQKANPDKIVLASERECCATCVEHTIKVLMAIDGLWALAGDPLPIVVIEAWWNNKAGRILAARDLRSSRG